MREELVREIRIKKSDIDYEIRCELSDTIGKILRTVFENDLVNNAKELIENNEFTEAQDVFEQNLDNIKEAKVEDIENYARLFRTTVKMKTKDEITKFSEENCNGKIMKLSECKDKEKVIEEMNRLNNAKKELIVYSDKEIEKAIAILESTKEKAINRI